ncbi:MAG: hypothetical protein ABEI75_02885 [Halobaculum sp.]
MSRDGNRVELPPSVTDRPDFLADGHFWVYELPEGTPLDVRLGADGRLVFAVGGDEPTGEFHADDAPPLFGFAARFLAERFRRSALREAVADPTAVSLRCVAVHRETRGYDPAETPAVVGLRVDHPDSSLLPHEVGRIFEALGVPRLPVVDKEVPARRVSADPASRPDSAWRDGPVHGLCYQKKGDGWAVRLFESPEAETVEPVASPESYADGLVSTEAVREVAGRLEDGGRTPTVEAVTDRLVDRAVRADFPRFRESSVDLDAVRSSVAARVADRLGRA